MDELRKRLESLSLPPDVLGSVLAKVEAWLPAHEAMVRAKVAEEMQPIYEEAYEKVVAYGTTYPVDAVGKCIAVARGGA